MLYNGIVEVQNRKGTEAGLVLVLIPERGVAIAEEKEVVLCWY